MWEIEQLRKEDRELRKLIDERTVISVSAYDPVYGLRRSHVFIIDFAEMILKRLGIELVYRPPKHELVKPPKKK